VIAIGGIGEGAVFVDDPDRRLMGANANSGNIAIALSHRA